MLLENWGSETHQLRHKLVIKLLFKRHVLGNFKNACAKKTMRTVLRVAQLAPLFVKESRICCVWQPIRNTIMERSSDHHRKPPGPSRSKRFSVFSPIVPTLKGSKHVYFAFLIKGHQVDPLQAWLVHSLSLTRRLLQRQEMWERLWERAWSAAHNRVISCNSCGLVETWSTLFAHWEERGSTRGALRYGRLELCGDEDRIWHHKIREAARLVRWRQVKREEFPGMLMTGSTRTPQVSCLGRTCSHRRSKVF